ncbi:MAG: alpha-amylase [Spirulina sp. SIO3F2]|nr:alpha-amylase [Spirulina sp. SIO3F2]
MTVFSDQKNTFARRVAPLLEIIYPEENTTALIERLFAIIYPHVDYEVNEDFGKWDEDKVVMITYGDTVKAADSDEAPLQTLHRFLNDYLEGVVTGVHILPFCPYSSDDGFAVIDYLAINPELGSWEDVKAIAQDFDLMADLVLNHISSHSEWFQQFKRGEVPGKDYFIAVDPDTDVSQVVRPRSAPLLVPVETQAGTQHVWATFSADQIDLNFGNVEVLMEMIKILLAYVAAGAKYIRLDAVGFLWKKLGTNCIHLPETHAVVRLLREVLQMVNAGVAIITETNVPNRENLSYFGNRNEAHMIYNFSLPPLLLNALLQGNAQHLRTWVMSMPPAPIGCAYFNFTASHDGIGLRPAEGLLEPVEYDALVSTIQAFGGKISYRRKADGSESPYELNISLFDALKGTVKGEDEWQIARFICSQVVMMSLEGIPALYIHSLLGTPNDAARVERTGHNRAINRHQWDEQMLCDRLAEPTSVQSRVLHELSRLIQIRRAQPAFHPNATQYSLQPINSAIFALWRQSMTRAQSIFSVHNLSDRPQQIPLSSLNLIDTDDWYDLIGAQKVTDIYGKLELRPYQSVWLTNQF